MNSTTDQYHTEAQVGVYQRSFNNEASIYMVINSNHVQGIATLNVQQYLAKFPQLNTRNTPKIDNFFSTNFVASSPGI